MATKTYVRTGRIFSPMTDDERTTYALVDAEALGSTFQADLDPADENWLIDHSVIGYAPDVAVTLPADGPAAGDLPTADGSGSYEWEAPA